MMQGQVHDSMPASHEMILPQLQPRFALFAYPPDRAVVVVVVWAGDRRH